MTTYAQIFENDIKWVTEKKASDKEFFENLAKGRIRIFNIWAAATAG